ncbi:hypothetical protein GGI11_002719 [Coemansia sp. RSA 2049]|nr:hypothetical protein GGI11_002719 [Coemansia sp. RSA 2049]
MPPADVGVLVVVLSGGGTREILANPGSVADRGEKDGLAVVGVASTSIPDICDDAGEYGEIPVSIVKSATGLADDEYAFDETFDLGDMDFD